MSKCQKKKVQELRDSGMVENKDFRVVWFGVQAEIKIIDSCKIQ